MEEEGYSKRLKSHPGLPVAVFMTFAGAMAGASNESFSLVNGMLFGACVAGGITFSAVLLSNIKRR